MRVYAEFLTSAAAPAGFPPASVPEVAFLGRSNVGKSSLLNALLGEKLAKTSQTPGRTRLINFFDVAMKPGGAPEVRFADLPGYGYAKLPRELTAQWPKFIDPYLSERPTLSLCLSLVDSNVPPQASDKALLEFLQASGRNYLVVATKCDRLSSNKLNASLRALRAELGVERILPFSAKTSAGRAELWKEIRLATETRL